MATKIQLRRDLSGNWTSTNPILAQGEPGVELDTNRMKVGDGVTAWNDLAYIIAETTTENQFIRVNGLHGYSSYPAAVSVSTDGLSWTQAYQNSNRTFNGIDDWVTCGMAVGGGHIVYSTYNGASNRQELRFADNAFQDPHMANSDNSRLGPHGEHLEFQNVVYAGDHFLAAGSYYDSARNDYHYPYAIYSQDGDNWTEIPVSLDYAYGLIQAEITQDGAVTNGLDISGVAHNGTGWLLGLHYHNDSTPTQRISAGAFYTTDLTATLTATNYISSTDLPGTYLCYFDGHGWVSWGNYNAKYYFNSSTDPRQGTWRTVDMSAVAHSLVGETVGFCNQYRNVAAGEINGVSYIVISAEYHGVFYTSDQGVTWNFVQPSPSYGGVTDVSATDPALLSWNGSSINNGERITIAGSPIPQLNGTWYFKYSNHGLYHDAALTVPLDATSWGASTTIEVYTTGTWKSHTLEVASTTGIEVGMIINGSGPWTTMEDDNWDADPNTVVSVDSVTNQVVMKYPMTDNFVYNIYFKPLMTRTEGDAITHLVYGNGAFVAFSGGGGDYGNGWRSFRTTDLVHWQHRARASESQYGPWDSYPGYYDLNFGAVTTHNGSIRSDSRNVPGFTNSLHLGDTFMVSVANSDDPALYDDYVNDGNIPGGPAYGQGGMQIDPMSGIWSIGHSTHCCCGGVNAGTGIQTYCAGGWMDSVEIGSWDYTWQFDNNDGFFYTNKIGVGTQTVNDQDSYIEQFNFYEDTIYMTSDRDLYIGSFYCSSREQANCACCGNGSANLHYDCATWFYADSDGSHIEAYGKNWDFTNDYTGHAGYYAPCACGVMYIPESSNIQTYGNWRIGDANDQCSYTYVGATDWADPCAFDIRISADCAYFHFTRNGNLEMPDSAYVQSQGYWAVGDVFGNTSYTYVGATDNIIGGCAWDVQVSANDTIFYFNHTGTFQLPDGGDIVDHNGYSLIASVPPLPQVGPITGDHTLALSDRGKHVYYTGTGGNTIYIPTNSVEFPLGSQIVIVTADHSCTLTPTDSMTTTLIVSGTGVDNSITINANTYMTLLKINTEKWIVRT